MTPPAFEREPKYFAVHFRGEVHAAFLTADTAYAYQLGNRSGCFHIVNADGEKVVMYAQPGHPGHPGHVEAILVDKPKVTRRRRPHLRFGG